LMLMSAQIQRSLSGTAISLLFRDAPVLLGTKFEYGHTVWWRTIPSNLASGALIDPLPQTFEDLYSLFFPDHLRHPPYRIQSIQLSPSGDDPQVTFKIPNLGDFQTVVIRARFQKADRIDAFFGKQIDGRGIGGFTPVANQWLDVYLHFGQNPFWNDEHGTDLR